MNNSKRVLACLALAGALAGAASSAHAVTSPAAPGSDGTSAPMNFQNGAAGQAGGLIGKVWETVVPKPGKVAGANGEGGVL